MEWLSLTAGIFLLAGQAIHPSAGPGPVWLSRAAAAMFDHQGSPPLPVALQQHDAYGLLPVGDLTGSQALSFHFQVLGRRGERLIPQVELRPVSESFRAANLEGQPIFATGSRQWVQVSPQDPLAVAGYHWQARVFGEEGPSPWVPFGGNEDDALPPRRFADADFFNLYRSPAAQDRVPAGFQSLAHIASSPLIVPGVETRQVSSFDRSEGNSDGGSNQPGLESYFYREGDAEVILEVKGPGQISRIWFAESNDPAFAGTSLQFLFDGDSAASYEILVSDMVAGDTPPFVPPLVLDAAHSSGGLVSYVPIPFREGLKLRLAGPHAHYQVTYQVFSQAGDVQTFTGDEDFTLVQHLWQRTGQDPKPARGNQETGFAGSLAPGHSQLLADLNGCGVVQSLELEIPQLRASILGTPPLADTVRSHRGGSSSFTLGPLAEVGATRLRLRRDCGQAPQVAEVWIDGVSAGAWSRAESSDRYRWCDDTFNLPPVGTPGATLAFNIASVHPDNPWHEAHYWLEQFIGGGWRIVDELDVGNPASEAAHGYGISGQTAFGWQTHTYAPQVAHQPQSQALLRDVRLQITADEHGEPDVDVPLGAFFGSAVGESNLESLLAGMQPETHRLYSYWPMPYGSRMRINLTNGGAIPVDWLAARIAYQPICYPLLGTASGYFRVAESLSMPTMLDVDHPLLAVTGAGRLVGLHLLVHSGDEQLIEGDERWHVDGLRTPSVRGTGTEDVFNGGWYYSRGRLIAPSHGANSTRLEGWIDQYRWYLGDAIPFASSLSGGIEHGPTNNRNADYSSWVFFYSAPGQALLLADGVDLDDPASLAEHQVVLGGPVQPFSLTARFEGDDATLVSDGGYRLQPGSAITATLAVDPHAAQVFLQRRYDQTQFGERLQVWVNGNLAGEWLDGGRNSVNRWRESTFQVPPNLTQGRDWLVIRLEPLAWAGSDGASLAHLNAFSIYHGLHRLHLPWVAHRSIGP